ncbi:oxidoreductase [Diplocarpon rosae]|nr:oxidoreductase [Diplocarpon rosae]
MSGWALGAHLPYLKHSGKYQIVAICNSSVESAEAAIKKHELSRDTKAYGDPEDLAKDADVDLVVCSVRVDRHFQTVSPSLKAGKDVYVEWPLGKNLAEAKELLHLKNHGGSQRTVVGLQARQAPILKEIKNLLAAGRIGTVLSSTWTGQGGNLGPTVMEAYAYVTPHFHAIAGEERAFRGLPGLEWRIYGETGEIRVSSSGPFLNIGYDDQKIEIFDFASDSVVEVAVEKDEFDALRDNEKAWELPSRNVGRIYKAFAQGQDTCTFEDAVERHALIEELYQENGIVV